MAFDLIDTKLQAYKLIHDPTCLLSLLYSKYLDIEEDYGLLIANQIIYNKPSHLNLCFKEQKTFYDKDEYLRRFYQKKESSSRITKLNEYYKNYQTFFCKAIFTDFAIGNILKNYQDTKAENFYKNNYEDTSLNKEGKEKSQNLNSGQSLSSLDNITYNETIFDKKNKQIIENGDKNISITLTLDSLRKKEKDNLEEKNLVNTSGLDDSFVDCVKNIVYYKDKKKESKKNKKEDKKEDKKEKDLKNICEKVNEKFKQKINNKDKIILEKSNKESNNSKNLFSFLNLGNSIHSPSNEELNYISKRNKKALNNNNNLFLSPQKNIQFYNTNVTSRLSQFKKQIPINIKYLNRNKSYHYNNNKKNSRIIVSNLNPNSKNNTAYYLNNQGNDYNLNKEKSHNMSKLIKNTNNKTDMKNNKSNKKNIIKYNQFLFSNQNNRNIINLKNNTYELINQGNKTKNATNQNILFSHYKKLTQSPRINRNDMLNQGIGSKYTLFKGNLSNELSSDINGPNNKRPHNKKIFLSSNSIDNNNNIHISSLSPKSISSNLNINKINSNTCIQNNINIINKIKIHSKNNKSNSNYNINFNNLFFYGANTPTNYLDNINNNNIINNQNKNSNFNKINTNFYLLNFNNFNNYSVDNNSRNQIKINLSQNKKEVKTHNNANNKNIKEKKHISFKNSGLKLNKNSIPFFTIYKVAKIKDFSKRKSKEKAKNIKLEINNKKNF